MTYEKVKLRSTYLFFILLLAYAILQIIYFQQVQVHLPGEGFSNENYMQHGVSIARYGSYATEIDGALRLETGRPPLYANILALGYKIFGEKEFLGLVLNNILLFLTLVIVYLIGTNVNKEVGVLSVAIFISDPILLKFANQNSSDVLFCFLFSLFILSQLNIYKKELNYKSLIVSALLLGAATFTRAVAMYASIIVVFMMFIVFWKRESKVNIAKHLIFFVLIQTIIVGGWQIRNHSITGNYDYAGMKSIHIFSFWAADVVAKRDNISMENAKKLIFNKVNKNPKYREIDQLVKGGDLLALGKKQKYLSNAGLAIIKENPYSAFLVFLDNIPILFTSYPIDALTLFYDEKDIANFNRYLKKNIGEGKKYNRSIDSRLEIVKAYYNNNMLFVLVVSILLKIFLFLIAITGVLGIVIMLSNKKNSNNRFIGLFFVLLGGYIIVLSCLTIQARFRLPLMPVWSVGSAYLIIMFWAQLKSIIVNRPKFY
jgi:4-amino-4-deoxy-L-arabinose transferase-like glycosyltransferase